MDTDKHGAVFGRARTPLRAAESISHYGLEISHFLMSGQGDFLPYPGGTGYQPVAVGNLPTASLRHSSQLALKTFLVRPVASRSRGASGLRRFIGALRTHAKSGAKDTALQTLREFHHPAGECILPCLGGTGNLPTASLRSYFSSFFTLHSHHGDLLSTGIRTLFLLPGGEGQDEGELNLPRVAADFLGHYGLVISHFCLLIGDSLDVGRWTLDVRRFIKSPLASFSIFHLPSSILVSK